MAHFEKDRFGTDRPIGLSLTGEVVADTLEEAEDASLVAASRFRDVAGFFTGSPFQPPELRRIAKVGPSGGVIDQYDYFYIDYPDVIRRVPLQPARLEGVLARFQALDEITRERVLTAIRWYNHSISSSDPVDAYVAAWFGLEAVGFRLDDYFHSGKDSCERCGELPKKQGLRWLSGVEHAVRAVAPEALEGRSIDALKGIRDGVAHSLADRVAKAERQARSYYRDLQVCLGTGILSALSGSRASAGLRHAALPRDYDRRPDARHEVHFDQEQPGLKPYLGVWVKVQRELYDETTRVSEEGAYTHRAGIKTTLTMPKPVGAQPRTGYVHFERRGADFRDLKQWTAGAPVREIELRPWRPDDLPQSWKRFEKKGA